jgi:hypothetical protein
MSAFGPFFFASIGILPKALAKAGVLAVVAFIAPTIRESHVALPIACQTSISAGSASAVIATVVESG